MIATVIVRGGQIAERDVLGGVDGLARLELVILGGDAWRWPSPGQCNARLWLLSVLWRSVTLR